MAQTDGKDRNIRSIQLFDLLDDRRTGGRIAGTVGQHDAVRMRTENPLRRCICRIDGYLASSPVQGAGDIVLCPQIQKCDSGTIPFQSVYFLAGRLHNHISDRIFFQHGKDLLQVVVFVGGDQSVHGPLLSQDFCQGPGIDSFDPGNLFFFQQRLYCAFAPEIARRP